MQSIKSGLLVAAAAAAILATPATAQNLGFETGNTSSWTLTYFGGATGGYGTFLPVAGSYLGYVQAGAGESAYSRLSQTFTLGAGGTISGYAGFQANDYLPYNDSGYLAVNGVHLLDWSVGSVGNYGNSGWNAFNFTALTGGSYTLELGVANHGDNGYNSGAVIDAVAVSSGSVPEPASWALMVIGFGAAGLSLRSRRSSVSFA